MHILVDHDANEYVRECVRQCDGEVGGLGYVELIGPGEFYISEFVLIEQDAGHMHIDFDGKDYIKEITRAAESGRENLLRVSWHSHHNMEAYFSSTDDKGVLEYKAVGMPWLISLVFNKSGDVASRIDLFDSEISSQITIRDMEYEVDISDVSITERVKNDLKKIIKPKKQWNKQTGGKKDKVATPLDSSYIEPIYPGWDDRDDLNPYDNQAWSDEDYEDVANQILSGQIASSREKQLIWEMAINMGMDPSAITEEEFKDIKELMEQNESTSF